MKDHYYKDYSYNRYKKQHIKQEWAGVNIGDAFKQNIPYFLRLNALNDFYNITKKFQVDIAIHAGCPDPDVPLVKPQISPFYTRYPAILSAYAAIGLTGYLEYESRVKVRYLFSYMAQYLENPAVYDKVTADPEIYKKIVSIITKCVQTRLLLEDLSRLPSASTIEIYRIFSASQQGIQFRSIPEIINAVVLYGDILPCWSDLNLHPVTESIVKAVNNASAPFFVRIPQTKQQCILELGAEWVKAVSLCLASYLPQACNESEKEGEEDYDVPSFLRYKGFDDDTKYRFTNEPEKNDFTDEIAPLNSPRPPSLFDPDNINEDITIACFAKKANGQKDKQGTTGNNQDKLKEILDFISIIEKSGSQQKNWEDMRFDRVERALRLSGFSQGPIQGNPTDGHIVSVQAGGGETLTGEIFDRNIELSDDLPAYEKLIEESSSISHVLKRSFYPNLLYMTDIERFRTSGSIDPGRLALAGICPAIFRRYNIHEKADRHGRPVLVICCDASGSMNSKQIKMLKILTTSWLISIAKSGIQLLAGLYHTGGIRQGVSGPLVEWLYHPKKTPAKSLMDAVRTLPSLPNSGTGDQADALSITFMLDEARKLSRGRMIYLILITDCKFCNSFHTGKSSLDEVCSVFQNVYDKFPGRLHTTLIALDAASKTGLEDIVDKIIPVSYEELNDCGAVAGKIALYVASCIKERNKWVAKMGDTCSMNKRFDKKARRQHEG